MYNYEMVAGVVPDDIKADDSGGMVLTSGWREKMIVTQHLSNLDSFHYKNLDALSK